MSEIFASLPCLWGQDRRGVLAVAGFLSFGKEEILEAAHELVCGKFEAPV
jgi:hypothetical protein